MDRLTEAAGMLRVGGLANMADKAEQPQLRRVAPDENLRQRYQEQEGTEPAVRPQRFNWWWNNVISNRIAQVQNIIYANVVPLQGDRPPPPPLRRVSGEDNLRALFQQDHQRQPQNLGPDERIDQPRGRNNDQAEPSRGILRHSRPAGDMRVRFAEGPPPGRGLRRRPRMNDMRGRYQADPDDDLSL